MALIAEQISSVVSRRKRRKPIKVAIIKPFVKKEQGRIPHIPELHNSQQTRHSNHGKQESDKAALNKMCVLIRVL